MKIYDFKNLEWLKITDLENLFEIYKKADLFAYDLNSTIYLDIDPNEIQTFICDSRMHWPVISYRIYGTTRLAWLLMKINDVSTEDMFKAKEPSESIKYIDQQFVQTIIKNINDYDEY